MMILNNPSYRRPAGESIAVATWECPRAGVRLAVKVHDGRSGAEDSMAGYHLEGPKAARMYEVILPKKLGYFGKVQEVLEDLFREEAIRAVPFVRRTIRESRRRDASFDEEGWIKTLSRASRGYSIYEMDGRYLGPEGPI